MPILKRFAPRHEGVEIELTCEQSTTLIPRVDSGDLDLALISSDNPRRGSVLFQESMVWVGSPQFELWTRDPLPIAVYVPGSLARLGALSSLARQGREHKVVYNSSSLAGQIVAVESGLAVAVLTRCSVPAHFQILGAAHGLGPLEAMNVAVYRSKASRGSSAVDGLRRFIIQSFDAALSGQAARG
ncbi:hypothetical protein K7A70_09240 [Pseudomonas putida]|nr:hypothetical protein [Pseudomonas putida]